MSGSPSEEGRKVVTSSFRDKAEELLRVIQPLKAVVAKVNQSVVSLDAGKGTLGRDSCGSADLEQLHKCLRALIYKVDPVAESIGALIEEFSNDSTPTTVDPTPRPVGNASVESFKSALSAKAKSPPPKAAKSPPAVKPKLSSAPVSAGFAKLEAKKAPPALRKKAPPPFTTVPAGNAKVSTIKKPPPKKMAAPSPAAVVAAEEPAKLDQDLLPDVLPDANLVPKPIQWQGIPKNKAVGSIWDGLLTRDKLLCTARELYGKMEKETAAAKVSELIGGTEPSATQPPMTTEFKFEVQYKVLNELFFEREEERANKNPEKRTSLADAAAAAAKSRSQTILDPRRSQILEIGMKGLGLVDDDFDQIKQAIDTLAFDDSEDPDGEAAKRRETADQDTVGKRKPWLLTVDRVERLLTLRPSVEDVKQLEDLLTNCAPDQRIARADRFLIALSKIPRFEQRATSVLTYLTFDKEASNMAEKLSKFLSVVDAAHASITSGVMKAVLALIVRIGNYVNCKSKRPVVSGVQVSSLESLKQIKSVDGKRSLLRVIAEHVDDQFPIGWRHLEWLLACTEVAEINLDDFRGTLSAAESKIKAIAAEVNHPQADAKFKMFFGPFVEESLTRISLLQERVKEASTKLTKLSQTLADKAKSTSECLAVLRKLAAFGRELFSTAKEIQTEKAAIEKRKQRESLKAATPTRMSTAIPSRPSSHSSKRLLSTIPSQPGRSTSPRPPSPSPTPVRAASPQKMDFECSLLPQNLDNSSDVLSSTVEEGSRNNKRTLRSRKSMPATTEETPSPTHISTIQSFDCREKRSQAPTPCQSDYRGNLRPADTRLRRRADESVASSSRLTYSAGRAGHAEGIGRPNPHDAKGTSASRSSTHKKTRSHAYHQTVRSVADALSPTGSQPQIPSYPSSYGPKDVSDIRAQVMERYSVLPAARSATRETVNRSAFRYREESSDDSNVSGGAFQQLPRSQAPYTRRHSDRRNDDLRDHSYQTALDDNLRSVHSPIFLHSTSARISDGHRVYGGAGGSGSRVHAQDLNAYRQSPVLMGERQRSSMYQGTPMVHAHHDMYTDHILSDGGVFLHGSPQKMHSSVHGSYTGSSQQRQSRWMNDR